MDLSPFDFVRLLDSAAEWSELGFSEGGARDCFFSMLGRRQSSGGGLSCNSRYPKANVYIATLIVDAEYQIGTEHQGTLLSRFRIFLWKGKSNSACS